jgi:glucose-1-phosphate cytidylyltransferase
VKVVILAGGLGTRLSEETDIRPKPMVEIGGRPILWHIMKQYSHFGFNEFVVALGYKSEVIKRYFIEQYSLAGSLTINFADGHIDHHGAEHERWKVHLVETGLQTNTGGRLKRLESWLKDDTFMLTYGDGVCDVDLGAVLQFHKKAGCTATVTAVRPPARFGGLVFDGHKVEKFTEKPQIGEGWINGGFMVFEPAVFADLPARETLNLEADVLEHLAAAGRLAAYQHTQFWQCMDTIRDKHYLETLWREQRAPWKHWA